MFDMVWVHALHGANFVVNVDVVKVGKTENYAVRKPNKIKESIVSEWLGRTKFERQLMKGESPVANGDENYSRDFTYIDNVIQANLLSLVTTNEKQSIRCTMLLLEIEIL